LIHWNNVAHYDVKIENIDVMENEYFKLIDFDICYSIDSDDDEINHFGLLLYYTLEILAESRKL
jgi:tRNA A-37 threonylcarbamoyl transferase component Bud32